VPPEIKQEEGSRDVKARTRRKIEMGARALLFCRLEAESSRGYAIALTQLEACVARASDLIGIQAQSLAEERVASDSKRKLVRIMRRAHLAHIRRVVQRARLDNPELAEVKLWRGTIPFMEFEGLVNTVLAQARTHQDLLVRHGLSEPLVDRLERLLEEFQQVKQQGIAARRIHVTASAGLDYQGNEAMRIVGIMDALNQDRFQRDLPRLRAWASLSNLMNPSSSTHELPPAA
jgi:hypothetical protein